MTDITQRSGFVVMPFGIKEANGRKVNFNKVLEELIEPAVAGLDIDFIRCDQIAETGLISKQMFKQLHEADVVVADISMLNANVFYELGIRHALRPGTTVIVKDSQTRAPFDIQDLKYIEYDLKKPKDLPAVQQRIAEFIKNGIEQDHIDSPVHAHLSLQIPGTEERLTKTERIDFQLRASPRRHVGMITGDLKDVKGIDVWVNSENTNMQMARFFDRAVSGVIRYLGARKAGAEILDDTIANELAAQMKGQHSVPAGHVFVTAAGELGAKREVKRIFHVATVQGAVGHGYEPVPDPAACVKNALDTAAEVGKSTPIRSLLFPIFGTGTGRGELKPTARKLIRAVLAWYEQQEASGARHDLTHVYFLTHTDRQYEVCRRILLNQEELKHVPPAAAKPKPPVKSGKAAAKAKGSRGRKG